MTATNVVESEAGPSGFTMDVLYELHADLSEEEFIAYAKKIGLKRITETQAADVRTLSPLDGERVVFIGNCARSTQTWAVYSNGRMQYWNSVGY